MAHIILPQGWRIPERQVTSESLFLHSLSRRSYLKLVGAGSLLMTGLAGCSVTVSEEEFAKTPKNFELTELDREIYPAPRNPEFLLDRAMTAEHIAAQYNNFYEFSEAKDDVWKRVGPFQVRPWTVEIRGLVKHPHVLDVDDIVRMVPMEERVYRLRCVEAWAMAVPWTGFPLKALIERVEPLSAARYIRFTSFHSPEVAMGQRGYGPWPYTEGIRLDEAVNELALLVTGIYGHPLPKQHGAPLRLILPWKYGFKSIKSIVSMEFMRERPTTFWNTMAPQEYGFMANVNPQVPHPRWSQESERMIGTDQRKPTLYLNGYEPWVGELYS